MLDAFSLLFASLLLQTPLAVATSALVLRLHRRDGGTAMQRLGVGWGVWAVRGMCATYGFWLTRSGLPIDDALRRGTTMLGLAAGYALLPLIAAGTLGLAGRSTDDRATRRWTVLAAVGGLGMGLVATQPAMTASQRVLLNLSLLSAATAFVMGRVGWQLWRVPPDGLTAGRQLAAVGLWAVAGKQAANLLAFLSPAVATSVPVLVGEHLVLVLAALGTLALLFERERVASEQAAGARSTAEAAALRASAELGIAIDAIGDPVALTDAGLALTRANPAFVSLVAQLGRGAAVPGTPLGGLVPMPVRDAWEGALAEALAGRPAVLRLPIPVGGTERRFDVRLTPVVGLAGVEGVLAALRDVTDDEAVTRELAAREAYYRSLIEHSSDLIAVLAPDGTIRDASPSAERVLGWSPTLLIGTQGLDLVHPDDTPALLAGLAQAPTVPFRRRTYTIRARRPDGRYAELEVVTSAVAVEDGERLIIINARDLTERRALEAQLLQAQRLDSLGRLAGGVAHDFNNLLTGILAHAEFARESAHDPAVVREEATEIEATARRAAELTHQLLTFARRERIAPTVFDVAARVRGLSRLLGRVVGEAVEVRTDVGDRPLPVLADAGQFEQAIVNLVVNARDAMPAGGVVTITTDRVPRSDLAGGGAAVRVVVRDTGVGMDDATRARIFEPFFTTKSGGRGTGLGLASVYGTITQAGGRISVDSAPESGTTFELLLPAHEGTPTEALPASDAVGAPPPSGTVLVVEDDELVRRVVVRLLGKHGFPVLQAVDGVEALARWRGAKDQIALVLTDVQMPRMNGRALAKAIAAERADVLVAYMSGYDADAVAAVPDAPPGPFIRKPFREAELLDGVRRALRREAS